MADLEPTLVAQINELLVRGGLKRGATFVSPVEFETKTAEWCSALGAAWLGAIRRLAPENTPYRDMSDSLGPYDVDPAELRQLAAVLIQLRGDLQHGYLREVSELVHADLFGDFLDMSSGLLAQDYKDAAAVIAGSVLEEHLKKLATKFSVGLVKESREPKKADTLNAELVKAGAYNKIEQKNVTAWLGIRNASAHGEYSTYDHAQVNHLIENVRSFITRHPA